MTPAHMVEEGRGDGRLSLWRGEVVSLRNRTPTLERICRAVAHRHGLTLGDLLGRSKVARLARPRHEAMLLCIVQRRWDGQRAYSFPRVGEFFKRDHTTIIHGVRAALMRSSEIN